MKNNTRESLNSISYKVDIYKDEIQNRNYKNVKAFIFGGMLLTGAISIVAFICYGQVYFTREYGSLFIWFIICNLYLQLYLRKHKNYTLISFYIMIAPILIIGILMGSFLDPESNAMTVMIMICTFFMFIIDKPMRIFSYIFITSIVFLVCSYLCKSLNMFVADFVNLIIYLSIGLGVNILSLKDRVESAENYTLAMKRANNDPLTSILNRGAGDVIVKELLKQGKKGAFIIADIDDFKNINDLYGHQTGDEVIREVSKEFKKVFREDDIVWRLGGDEFAIFALNLTTREVCEERLKQVQAGISKIKTANSEKLNVKLSMGCAICCNEFDFDMAYKNSDDALYEVKQTNKNGYSIREI